MELVMKLLTVLALGASGELWAAMLVGLALQLNPIAVGTAAAIGDILGALVVVLLGQRVRIWLVRRHGGKKEDKGQHGLIYRTWRRYGVIGLGLLAPLLTGDLLGAALGLTLGVPAGRLMLWISLGTVFWTAWLTLAGALGLAGIEILAR